MVLTISEQKQIIQDKAQFAENDQSFSRTETQYWVIWSTPYGRTKKGSFALLRLFEMACHSMRGPPSAQPFLKSLKTLKPS